MVAALWTRWAARLADRRVAAALACVGLIAFVASFTIFPRSYETVDLTVYREAAAGVWSGRSLYATTYGQYALPFTYPPFAVLLFSPLLWVSPAVLPALWTIAALAALFATLLLVVRAVRAPAPGSWALALALFGPLLWLEPVQNTLAYGQVNLFLMLAVLLDLARPGRRTSGVLTGLATAVKLTPGIFLLYLLARRRYRDAAVASVSAAAATALAWAVFPGFSWTFFTGVGFDASRPGLPQYVSNQSVHGELLRLLDGAPEVKPIWLLLAIGLVGVGLRAAADVAAIRGEVLGVTTAALVGLLVSPVTWSHHYVWAAALIAALLVMPATDRHRYDVPLALGWVVLLWAQPIWWLPSGFSVEYGYAWWQHLVGALYLLAALGTLVLLRRGARQLASEHSPRSAAGVMPGVAPPRREALAPR